MKPAGFSRRQTPCSRRSSITHLPNYSITNSSLRSFLRQHHRRGIFKRLAGVCRDGHQQGLFAINQVAGVEGGQLETMAVGDGVSGAGLDAVAAEDAAVVVDVVDLGVALGAADAVLFRVLGGLNVDTVGGTGGGAKET